MAIHSSILAWRIPWPEEPGRLQSMGCQRVRHDLSDLACTHYHFLGSEFEEEGGACPLHFIPCRRFQRIFCWVLLTPMSASLYELDFKRSPNLVTVTQGLLGDVATQTGDCRGSRPS